MIDARTELLYWLSIMRDHAIFLLGAFSSKEKEYIESTKYFKDYFQSTLEKVEHGADWQALKPEILKNLQDFKELKKKIIKDLLTCKVELNFPPTFINHMVNEAVEFERFLVLPPPAEDPFCQAMALLELHKIWLADAGGHASTFISLLDPTETLLIAEAKKYKEVFTDLFVKASELYEMLVRTKLSNGALAHLSEEATEWIKKFIEYLNKLERLRCYCKAMAAGTLVPLVANHMVREERYYLSKIETYLHRIKK